MTTTPVQTPPRTVPLQVYGAIGAGIIAMSLAAIFIRFAQNEGLPSLLIAAGRLTLAALILTPFALAHHRAELRRLSSGQIGLAVASGVLLALHFAAWISSLEYTSVLISVVLVTTGPLWVAVLEVVFLGARL
jgi:drug/metabolite transporter (DMT)-like permease